MTVAARLAELGIQLPAPAAAVANYVPFVRAGDLLHISGQLSNDASGGVKGTVGADVSPEQAQAAARMCGVNLLAQMSAALDGDLERVVRVVKLGGFVQAAGDFEAIPAVINGCSDLMVEVFGDRGRHARSAVGVYRLPLGFAVEVDAIVEVR
ncbi:RidA family protein [Brevundimonas sp.]|uniref:RidA family protein n=1 Tax=Brevundimonas sp. TaxID=1871086 RepID=UPI0035B13841